MKSIRTGQGGFTLIEMLLVVIIIGILAAMIVPSFVGRSTEARHKAAWGDIATIKTQASIFELDRGRFPASLDEMMNPPGKYFPPDQDFLDPWGQPYIYTLANGFPSVTYSQLAEGEAYR